jgi:hypothetical protein
MHWIKNSFAIALDIPKKTSSRICRITGAHQPFWEKSWMRRKKDYAIAALLIRSDADVLVMSAVLWTRPKNR